MLGTPTQLQTFRVVLRRKVKKLLCTFLIEKTQTGLVYPCVVLSRIIHIVHHKSIVIQQLEKRRE